MQNKTMLTVGCMVNASITTVWECWTKPEHITQWCSASPEWHCPRAENDLRTGGRFVTRMEAKDGSMGFDFGGVYDAVTVNEYIEYTMDDDRKAKINFIAEGNSVKVVEIFEAENTNPPEMQQFGWQAILDNFKKYTETAKWPLGSILEPSGIHIIPGRIKAFIPDMILFMNLQS